MTRPNVVLILVDDMGFSDIGCYGGEVKTPNIDRLAQRGVRFSQFYNTARCSPSRASLLTGLHPHQTGIGVLTNDDRPRGYAGAINERCVTMAEVLKAAGYATCLSGKWHLASEMRTPNDAWPTRRGFDRFFGTLTGCGSFFQPGTLTRGEVNVEDEALDPDFYYTDAISAEAVAFVEDRGRRDATQPFFLYAAYTAPHWPLHARDEDIARYRGTFDEGWDKLRERRMKRLREFDILDDSAALSERDPTQPAWTDAEDKEWQARRMEVYAAQIDRMDQGVGRIVAALEATGTLDDTLIMFLSDNGGSDEGLPLVALERFKQRTDILRLATRDGREVRIGNEPSIAPGTEDTYASYGRAWANLSNTPFRYYKQWTHEGGISTPLIVHWPRGNLRAGSVVRAPFQLVDVLPTVIEATGATYPGRYKGRDITPPEGRSLLPALRGEAVPEATLYWEHTGNAAIRRGRWKMVRRFPQAWELYDVTRDRSELHDVAEHHPEVVDALNREWQAWADRVGVIPWQGILDLYLERGQPAREAIG
ncbi:MAG TPA: arylsulfatase [Casimicrobiaceae bacterium]|nr:arylsulfatase [Casimicrobiaceae bacterium]